ncbi:DUF6796 family protein [Cellulophaga baltica]|uniref:DUF6796 family protein n=1 Tax=Cellulophaga baltica TaxID=76594 RepID=UPI0004270562|nr:DUF6796 family protein [Cellulophaga baltica]
MSTNTTIKTLGYLGLLGALFVGIGEYLLHYSPNILGHAKDYEFFAFVSLEHMTLGHFLTVIGLPFYFAGYIHIYLMLRSGNETFARLTLALGFIAFAVGGIWIGSRATIGNIVHLKEAISPEVYKNLIAHYTNHTEILVQALRVVIALLSITFVSAILKGGTYYKKWMAIFNPILILIAIALSGLAIPSIGQHTLPILMNITHFILFSLSIYQLNNFIKPLHHD